VKKSVRTERLNIRLTVAERAAIDRGAERARKDVTRFVLERALSQQDDPPRSWLSRLLNGSKA
jgi:uncharacterized protein (DUF1778 family)